MALVDKLYSAAYGLEASSHPGVTPGATLQRDLEHVFLDSEVSLPVNTLVNDASAASLSGPTTSHKQERRCDPQ